MKLMWNIFISQDDFDGNTPYLFDTNNYFNNNGRFKISKELLMYGIKQSYFFDVSNLSNYNNLDMDNLELKHLFNDSIFVHHPYEHHHLFHWRSFWNYRLKQKIWRKLRVGKFR